METREPELFCFYIGKNFNWTGEGSVPVVVFVDDYSSTINSFYLADRFFLASVPHDQSQRDRVH